MRVEFYANRAHNCQPLMYMSKSVVCEGLQVVGGLCDTSTIVAPASTTRLIGLL